MFSKLEILLPLVFTTMVVAEPPVKGSFNGYEPSGWRPSGPAFQIPDRLRLPLAKGNLERPNAEYGAPNTLGGNANEYRTPQETLAVPPVQPAVTYGPPEDNSTESTTTELPTSTPEVIEDIKEKEDLKEDDADEGVYYIYHPDGLLQRVSYLTKDDKANMAYNAQVKYENVEPIKNPVYTYDRETFVFRRLY